MVLISVWDESKGFLVVAGKCSRNMAYFCADSQVGLNLLAVLVFRLTRMNRYS